MRVDNVIIDRLPFITAMIVTAVIAYKLQLGLYKRTKRKTIIVLIAAICFIVTFTILFLGANESIFSSWFIAFVVALFLGVPIVFGSVLALIVIVKRFGA